MQRDFENSIEKAVDIIVGEDKKPLVNAAQKGALICDSEPNSKLAAGIKTLYNRLMADEDVEIHEQKSWLGNLFAKG